MAGKQTPTEFAAFVKYRRERLGLNMREFADKTGYKPEFISMVEKGIRMPDMDRIPDFAEALQITPFSLAKMAMMAQFPRLARMIFRNKNEFKTQSKPKENSLLDKLSTLDPELRQTVISMVDRLYEQQQGQQRRQRSA